MTKAFSYEVRLQWSGSDNRNSHSFLMLASFMQNIFHSYFMLVWHLRVVESILHILTQLWHLWTTYIHTFIVEMELYVIVYISVFRLTGPKRCARAHKTTCAYIKVTVTVKKPSKNRNGVLLCWLYQRKTKGFHLTQWIFSPPFPQSNYECQRDELHYSTHTVLRHHIQKSWKGCDYVVR